MFEVAELPLQHLFVLLQFLKQEGRACKRVRVDEDGALAYSAEFCALLVECTIVLETAGEATNPLKMGKLNAAIVLGAITP